MLVLVIYKLYVECGDKTFRQDGGTPMGTSCILFLYAYKAELNNRARSFCEDDNECNMILAQKGLQHSWP